MTQMNPHFIFNTMSAIQQFINLNDKKAANRYLAKFAELMRRILNNSNHSIITLKEELESLDLYLQLEALRFNYRFRYNIIVSPDIDKDKFVIPSMLIQPYVENAILHGLSGLNKEKKGQLTIDIQLYNECIKCVITDNGIGRKKAQEIKHNRTIKHESQAMKNINERINLLNSRTDKEYSVKIIDLYDKNYQAIGTKVEIVIPI
jgi:LytS/YehU family sensor histidine kinase